MLQIARDKGGEIVDTEVVGAFPRRAGRRVLDYLDDRVAVVEEPDGIRGLVTSQLPLRTKHGGRGRVPVDLDLIESATDFLPKAPLVPFTFPRQLSRGLSFTRDDVGVRFLVPGGDVAGQGIGGRVLYANVATDSDLLLSPTSTGLESFMQLRSPASPRSHTMQFTLPRGYSLAAASAGDTGETAGIALKKGDKVMAELQPPTAVDAQGQDLPTRYQLIEPDKVRVEVDYNPDEVAFPVYVDPVFDGFGSEAAEYGAPNNFAGWIRSSVPAGFSDQSSASNRKVRATKSGSNPVAGSYLTFEFRAHAHAYIYQAEFWNMAHTANNSDSVVGLFTLGSPVTIEPGGVFGSGVSELIAYREDGVLSGAMRLACARDGCLGSGDASPDYPDPSVPGGANRAVWGLKADGPPGAPTNFAEATLGGAMISQFEQDKPVWETAPDHGGSSVGGWHERGETFNTQLYPYDKGFGVERVWISVAGTDPVWDEEDADCDGSRTDPCYNRPATEPGPPEGPALGRLTWTTNSMSEGINYVVPQAKDVVGNQTHEVIDNGRWEVKVDKTKPADPTFSGTLTSNNGWVRDDAHTLTVNNATDSRSGVQRVEYTITRDSDGAQVAAGGQDNSGCSASGCPTTFSPPPTFNLNLSGLNGAHTLHVKVKDQLWTSTGTYKADHIREKDYKFEIDRTAPTITSVGTTPNPDRWLKDGEQPTATVNATDAGSGIKSFTGLTFPAGSPMADVDRPCGGLTAITNPPRCSSTDSQLFSYAIDNTRFPNEGPATVVAKVKDAAGNESGATNTTVRVDRTPPTIEASGTLYDARNTILFNPSYQLNAKGKDGSATPLASRRSGTKRVRILVKEAAEPVSAFQEKASQDIACPVDPGSCERTTNWTLNTSQYANKQLTIRIEAKDQLDQESVEEFNVWVLADLGGALPVVEDRLGLEEFWNYDSTETGAGSRAHVNLDTGNLVWHSVPVVNPGRGLSTVVNLTANSQETFEEALLPENELGDYLGQYNTAGRGFSLGISGLTRVNDRLDLSKLTAEHKIRITDVDGTRHTFTSADDCKTFAKPPGVHLRLRRYSAAGVFDAGCTAGAPLVTPTASDPLKYWAATRPDGVTHFFDARGYQTAIEDRNGNTIQFKYEFRTLLGGACQAIDADGKLAGGQTIVDPAVCPRRLVEVRDPEWTSTTNSNRRMVLTYHSNRELVPGVPASGVISGPVKDITDFGGRKLVFDYEEGGTEYLTNVTQAHGTGAARSFGFDYEAGGEVLPLKRRALTQVTDPKGMATPSSTDGRTTFAHESDGVPALAGLGDGLVSRKRTGTVTNRRSKNRSISYAAISEGDNVRRATVTDALSHQWVHKMDSRGRARSLVDPKSTETTLEWDNSEPGPAPDVNGVTKLTEAAGSGDEAVTDMTYNPNGQLLEQTTYPKSGDTRTRTLAYRPTAGTHIADAATGANDGAGTFVTDLQSIANPKANTGWTFGLDPRGNVTSRTDAATRSASTVYDAQGRVTSETDEEGNVTKYEGFHPSGQPKVMIDPRGTSHEGGDAETDHRWIYKYDLVGNVTDVTDPRGAKTGGADDIRNDFTTKLTYDALDRLKTESIPKDTAGGGIERISKSRVYDANDNVTASTTGNRTTAITYTQMDKPDAVTAPGSEVTRYGYDDLDRLESRTDPKGDGATAPAFRTDYLLDSVGRRIAETRNAPNETPAQLITSYAFDRRDNEIGIIDPKRNHSAGRTAQQAATAAETDGNLRTKLDYNDDDELIRTTDRPNAADTTAGIRPVQTEYEYDGNGNRTAVIGSRAFDSRETVGSDFKTEYEFDHRDQLTSVTNPADEETVYTRRRDGKVIAQTSPRGVEDGTKDSAVPGGIEPYKYFTTRFDYNANGDLTSRSVPFRPDQYGRTEAQLKAWRVGYTRDAVGNPSTITDARGNSFNSTFYDTGDIRTTGRPSWWKLDWGEGEHGAPDAGERFGAQSDPVDSEIGMNGPSLVENGDRSSNVTGDASAPDLPSSESAGNFGEVDPEELPGLLPSAGQTEFTYDNEMRLTHVEDAESETRQITYEASGRVDKKIWPFKSGETIEHEYGYDTNGNLTAYEDGRGQLTTFDYDGLDRRVGETAPGSRDAPAEDPDPGIQPEETVYAYDPNGNLDARVTPLGETRKFEFSYDSLDRLNVETNPAGESWSYAYNTGGMPIVERSPRGNTGNPVAPPSPDPTVTGSIYDTDRSYDAAERLSEIVDGFENDTDFQYDKDGNRTQVTAPGAGTGPNALDVDRVTQTSYDGRGLPWQETIGTGDDRRTTVKEFDENGNLRRIVNPKGLGSDREPSYDDTGVSSGDNLRDATEHATVRLFSADDLASEEFFPWGDRDARDQRRFTQKWTRDNRGRVQTHSSAYEVGAATAPQKSYTYFETDWVASVSDEEIHDPDPPNPRIYGQLFDYDYDKAGNQILWESENSDTAEGRKITRTFYPSGQLATRKGQRAVEDTHTTRTYSYFYNPNRSLIRMDDTNPARPAGQETRSTTFTRDAAEREQIVNETWATGEDTRFVYDEAGNVTRRQTDGRWNASTSTYVDSAGGRDDAKTTDFTYDRLEREKTMDTTQGSDPSRGVDRDYWPSGELQRKTILKPGTNNNIDEYRFFTSRGEVSKIRRQKVGESGFQKDQGYSYDANGNRTEDERGEHEFNARDQLAKWMRSVDHKVASKQGTEVTYLLNATGAIEKKTDEALPGSGNDDEITYTYSDGDRGTRLAKVEDKDTIQTYTHDDFGSVIRVQSKLKDDNTVFPPLEDVPDADQLPPACEGRMGGADKDTTLYCFDEFERMVTARGSGVGKETGIYDYDGFDRRDSKIERIKNPTTGVHTDRSRDFSYVGSSRSLSKEIAHDGRTLYYDYNSAGEREGQSRAPAGQTEPTVYRSYGKDANGSVEAIEEENGTVPDDNEYVYDPYGDRDNTPTGATDPDQGLSGSAQDNPFRYEGFYLDSGVKTYDMQARQYRPDTGRFLSQDRFAAAGGDINLQSDPLTQNRYAFAGGNPINNIEFDGHDPHAIESSCRNNGGMQCGQRVGQAVAFQAAGARRPSLFGSGLGGTIDSKTARGHVPAKPRVVTTGAPSQGASASFGGWGGAGRSGGDGLSFKDVENELGVRFRVGRSRGGPFAGAPTISVDFDPAQSAETGSLAFGGPVSKSLIRGCRTLCARAGEKASGAVRGLFGRGADDAAKGASGFDQGFAVGAGFRSFSQAKRVLGPAGEGKHWHHLVEQTPGNVGRFGPQAVHNTGNLVRLDIAVHRQVSGYFSSKQRFTGGQTVRQWLSGQSYARQQQFAREKMAEFGG